MPNELKAVAAARRRRKRFGRLMIVVTVTVGVAALTLILLLPGFSPFGVRAPATSASGTAPARRTRPDPIVRVRIDVIELDGKFLASTPVLEKMQRIDPLYEALMNRQMEDRGPRLENPRPTRLIMSVDDDVPSIVTKSAFQTAAFAGYTDISFVSGDGSVSTPSIKP